MILVLLSNGAAKTILREASENGTYYSRPTAAFYGADGFLVRQSVTLADLGAVA